MTAVAFDPNATDFGTDVALLDDLSPAWGLTAEEINYAYSCARRLSQREGAMDFYDPTYVCLDLRGQLSAKMGKADIAALQGRIAAAQESDPRTNSCTAAATFDPTENALTVELNNDTAQGPFDLVLKATSLSVSILSINGVAAPTPQPAADAGGATIIMISGGSSLPGPPGPPGTSNPSRSYGLQAVSDDSGAEVAQAQTQLEVDWGSLGSSLTLTLSGMGSDSGAPGFGNGTFRLRIDGSDGAADGTAEVTLTAISASATRLNQQATIANPGGHGRVILTVQSSAATKTAALRDITLDIQSN